jgi:hypothetical protein
VPRKVGAHLTNMPSQDVAGAGGTGQQGAGVGKEGKSLVEVTASRGKSRGRGRA